MACTDKCKCQNCKNGKPCGPHHDMDQSMNTAALEQESNYGRDARFSINDNINLHANETIMVKSGSINVSGDQPNKFYQRHFDLDQINESPTKVEVRPLEDQKMMNDVSTIQIVNSVANDDNQAYQSGDSSKVHGNKCNTDISLQPQEVRNESKHEKQMAKDYEFEKKLPKYVTVP